MTDPLVSVCCITYNHEKFIREAIEGFLIQKTTFPIEIIIHDDASTDDTATIIREYQKRYPEIIKPIYQTENQWSKGIRPSQTYVWPKAKGKYIALCEGDDYWTDPRKLQKQVDLLESDTSIFACFTNAKKINEITNHENLFVSNIKEGEVSVKTIMLIGGGLYPTASIVFKNDKLKYDLFDKISELNGDDIFIYLLCSRGKIYFLNQVTCVYRRWTGGVFSSISTDTTKLVDAKKRNIQGLKKFNKFSNLRYDKYIKRRISLNSFYIIKKGRGVGRLKFFISLHYKEFLKLFIAE